MKDGHLLRKWRYELKRLDSNLSEPFTIYLEHSELMQHYHYIKQKFVEPYRVDIGRSGDIIEICQPRGTGNIRIYLSFGSNATETKYVPMIELLHTTNKGLSQIADMAGLPKPK